MTSNVQIVVGALQKPSEDRSIVKKPRKKCVMAVDATPFVDN